MRVVNYMRTQWDRVGAWGCVIAGAVALIVGYVGVSGTPETGEQVPYVVSGGMTGLFLLGLGALLWLSADLRDEWRKLHAIHRHLRDAALSPTPVSTANALTSGSGVGPAVRATASTTGDVGSNLRATDRG